MLVLTRKKSEQIRIGEDIVVKVLRTTGSVVQIGIDAPRNVQICRDEIFEDDPKLGPAVLAGRNS